MIYVEEVFWILLDLDKDLDPQHCTERHLFHRGTRLSITFCPLILIPVLCFLLREDIVTIICRDAIFSPRGVRYSFTFCPLRGLPDTSVTGTYRYYFVCAEKWYCDEAESERHIFSRGSRHSLPSLHTVA
jgi:hypothetical protein